MVLCIMYLYVEYLVVNNDSETMIMYKYSLKNSLMNWSIELNTYQVTRV